MSTPKLPDYHDYHKAHPRMREPMQPVTLSERLRYLAAQKQKASTWWAEEIKKLIIPAEQLEAKVWRMGWQGVLVGATVILILAWYVLAF